MSISSELTALQQDITNARTAIVAKGGTVTSGGGSSQLATDIATIPTGSGGTQYILRTVTSGKLSMPSGAYTLPSDVTDIGNKAMYYAFYYSSLTSADFSSLTTISGGSAIEYAFYYSSLTSADFSSLTTLSGGRAMANAFYRCTSLTSVDLGSLTTISGSNSFAMQNTFYRCTSLTSVDLSSLTTIGGYAMYNTFSNCTSLTSVNLSSLTTLNGSYAMQLAFSNCTSLTSLSFPALTSTSFGSYTDQFNEMLQGCTGVTVHFPSNLQSVIGSWTDVTAGFGGTNTTILWDLSATE